MIITVCEKNIRGYLIEKEIKRGGVIFMTKQGQKRPLDTPKRMIESRERERRREKDKKVEGEIREREM